MFGRGGFYTSYTTGKEITISALTHICAHIFLDTQTHLQCSAGSQEDCYLCALCCPRSAHIIFHFPNDSLCLTIGAFITSIHRSVLGGPRLFFLFLVVLFQRLCSYIPLHSQRLPTYMNVHGQTLIQVYMYTHVHAYAHAYAHECVNIFTHTYKHTHRTNTHAHTNTHFVIQDLCATICTWMHARKYLRAHANTHIAQTCMLTHTFCYTGPLRNYLRTKLNALPQKHQLEVCVCKQTGRVHLCSRDSGARVRVIWLIHLFMYVTYWFMYVIWTIYSFM